MALRTKSDKFPLWLHPTGQYGKKIRGKYHYFGKDKDAALAEYVRVKADLEAGRKSRPMADDAATVADVCNRFLTAKRQRVDSHELTARMWAEYHKACETVVNAFGSTRSIDDLRLSGAKMLSWHFRSEMSGMIDDNGFALNRMISCEVNGRMENSTPRSVSQPQPTAAACQSQVFFTPLSASTTSATHRAAVRIECREGTVVARHSKFSSDAFSIAE